MGDALILRRTLETRAEIEQASCEDLGEVTRRTLSFWLFCSNALPKRRGRRRLDVHQDDIRKAMGL